MKKNYERIFCGVVLFNVEDVVRTSLGTNDGGDNFGDIGDFVSFFR